MKTAIENAHVVLENGIIRNGVIITDDGIIKEFGTKKEVSIPDDAQCIDVCGAYVGPGFVDIHVHGGGGYNVWDNPKKVAAFLLSHGETSILPSPPYELNCEEYVCAAKTIGLAMKECPSIKGMYMEGPYINVKYGAYAHINPWRHPISKDDYAKIVDEAGKDAKVWVVAPEREGITEFMDYARKVNPDVVFAIGHSEATPIQIRKLGKFRPKILTHAMNATGRGDVPLGTRGYGPDEYCLKESEMYAELISDSCSIHVHSELQQLILHCKGVEKVILITDNIHNATPTPKEFAHIDDLNFDDCGSLSGSRLTMDQACRNIMCSTNCGIAQAFLMASTNPAKAIAMDAEIGSIDIGKRADLVFVDDWFNVKKVMIGGSFIK
ncbi:MAG: amidohydrolase family protein [Clostridia bacterium]|nr:amidohydrolase family protein [Clostridia bacterium]